MIKKIKIFSILIATIFSLNFSVCGIALAAPPTDCQTGDANACLQDPSVSKLMNLFKTAIKILSGAVILIATIMIIIAGITYTTSSGDPAKVTKAKTMITNVVIGVVAYLFLWAFLQWLIPGGVFN